MEIMNMGLEGMVGFLEGWLWIIASVLLFVITLLRAHPLAYTHDATFWHISLVFLRRVFLIALPFWVIAVPLVTWFCISINNDGFTGEISKKFGIWYLHQATYYWRLAAAFVLLGLMLRFSYARYLKPHISNLKRALRANVSNENLSDIRNEKNKYLRKDFNPEDFYKKEMMFFGLDESNKPIYVTLSNWLEMNMQLIGPTRFGKGILMGVLIDQAIRNDFCVFYIDPKGDANLPHIMADRAKETNRDFIYCDLNDSGVGGWHPFMGGDERSRRARLLMALGLESTGNESDFYKINERGIADELLKSTLKINGMIQLIEANSELKENGKRLYGGLIELSKVKSLNPKGDGLSIEKSLLNNAIVYIRGSLDDRVVKDATRVFIMELIQEAKRLEPQRKAHLFISIDEMRFLTSNALVDATATVTGSRTNLLLAYQSKMDLRNLDDANINALAAETSINTNCQLKFLYATQDPDTAEWVEKMSGQLQKLVTRAEYTAIGHLGEEAWENRKILSQTEEAYITKNVMFSMEPRVGILFQPSTLPQIIFTSYVKTNREHTFDKQHYVKSDNL